jgi:hypothetical protein
MRKFCNRTSRQRGPLQNNAGERLYKQVAITVFFPGNKKRVRTVHRAPPGKGFNAENIQETLEQWAGRIEGDFPSVEYKLVTLGPAEFNFVSL